MLFSHHFDVLTQTQVFKDTVEDLDNLEDKCKASVRGLQSAQGYSADQLVTAILEKMLSPSMLKQWRQYTHKEKDPPTVKVLMSFVDRQHKSAPDNRLAPVKNFRGKSAPTPHKKTVLRVQESTSDKCTCCKLRHTIYSCPEFQKLSVSARLEQVKQKGMCFNCLGLDHAVAQSPSKRRCRQCQARHCTLLQRSLHPKQKRLELILLQQSVLLHQPQARPPLDLRACRELYWHWLLQEVACKVAEHNWIRVLCCL